ncbi:MAG TPA: DivIVA domain-containing protein [Ilumatobacteraceae bacterium]|nr:DivIVA domain-containing protein [Ilumatobacteraceae bacterium]
MSPQRVRTAEFPTVRKGADPKEVKAFLDDVADELERAQNQSTAMEARARAAVARLQEITESGAAAAPAPAPVQVEASADESETISRTLLLAQRTADTAVAEARSEAARIVGSANDEAATTLDSTREMAAQLLDEARSEARRAGEIERMSIAGEVEALKARRDFLESDVEQLELFLTEQRNRLREAATSIVDIVERVPGGLGAARPPLLSASDDELGDDDTDDEYVQVEPARDIDSAPDDGDDAPDDALLIVADIADADVSAEEPMRSEAADDATQSMPDVGNGRAGQESERDEGDFRFSFDDDRN